jgi:hypothetical protein
MVMVKGDGEVSKVINDGMVEVPDIVSPRVPSGSNTPVRMLVTELPAVTVANAMEKGNHV